MWINGFKSGTDISRDHTYTALASKKDVIFRPRGSRPDALPAHVYPNIAKYNLLYERYNFSVVVYELCTL